MSNVVDESCFLWKKGTEKLLTGYRIKPRLFAGFFFFFKWINMWESGSAIHHLIQVLHWCPEIPLQNNWPCYSEHNKLSWSAVLLVSNAAPCLSRDKLSLECSVLIQVSPKLLPSNTKPFHLLRHLGGVNIFTSSSTWKRVMLWPR